MNKPIRIAVVGSGYVGLVAAVCFAEIGHDVVCVDNDESKVAALQSGDTLIHENHLPALLDRYRNTKIRFTTDLGEATRASDAIFIAVGTPQSETGDADLSYVEAVACEIARSLTSYKVIVEKSTVPVYTNEWIRRTIERNGVARHLFDVVSNPEFLREGFAVEDLMRPDRVVVGVRSQRPVPAMKEIYAPFNAPIIVTDINSAELIKHASNSFLALKISYINAISVLCEATGANVQEVANGMGMDERIGRRFLEASLGFGGSCFPKDLSAFIKIAEQVGCDFSLLKGVQEINARQMDRFVKKISDTLWVLKDKTIGVLGLAFKQNTDDLRMSPAIELCQRLQKEGARLRVHDPKAMEKAKAVLKDVTFVEDMNGVAEGCDALVIATEWEQFKKLDLERARRVLSHPIMFDGRNLFDPAEMERLGFIYKSIGR